MSRRRRMKHWSRAGGGMDSQARHGSDPRKRGGGFWRMKAALVVSSTPEGATALCGIEK